MYHTYIPLTLPYRNPHKSDLPPQVERVSAIADALSQHIYKLSQSKLQKNPEMSIEINSAANNLTRNRLLEGIYVYRIHDQNELTSTIQQLSGFFKIHTKIRVILIDSIAFHFRHNTMQDNIARSRLLSNITQTLNQIAFNYNIAIVVTNHVTTRFSSSSTATSTSSTHLSEGMDTHTSTASMFYIYYTVCTEYTVYYTCIGHSY